MVAGCEEDSGTVSVGAGASAAASLQDSDSVGDACGVAIGPGAVEEVEDE